MKNGHQSPARRWAVLALAAPTLAALALLSAASPLSAVEPQSRLQIAGSSDQEAPAAQPPLDSERIAVIDKAAAAFKPVAMADIADCVAAAERMVQAMQAGDRAGAERAWIDARVGWERSEIVSATMLPDLDKAIDSWPDATSGFHAVELQLFASSRMPIPEAQQLLENLKTFQHVIGEQPFTGRILMVGVASLAYEVGESKSKGGESDISGNSLADMQNNVAAVDRAWHAIFAPTIADKDPKLAKRIENSIARLKKLVFVPSLTDIDPPTLEQEAETLAGAIADADYALGWYHIDFTDSD